jgi:hypothetical protein
MSRYFLPSFPVFGPRFRLGGVLLLMACLGCGSEYERRLHDSGATAQMELAKKYDDKLTEPKSVPGTALMVRLPKPGSIAPEGDPRRSKPGNIPVSDIKLACEGMIPDSGGGQMSYYLYVGVIPGTMQSVTGALASALGIAPQLTKKGDWADVSCDTPQATTVVWRKLSLTGKQDFYYKDKDNKETFNSMDGVVDIYLREETAKNQVLALVWRVPTHIEASLDLSNLETLVAGCMQ